MYNNNINSTYSQYTGGLPPLSKTQNKMILFQLEKTVCKIHKVNGMTATGFLCKIPFPDQFSLLHALVTNNHVVNKQDLQLNKTIKITFGDHEIEKYLKLDESRLVYTNSSENIDITIIQIKPKEDNLNDFLDVDENIFKTNYKEIYQRNPVYTLQYPKGRESSHSEGIINNINNISIEHTCSVDFASSGAPILKLSNFKVIGVHKRLTKNNYNEGIFMKFIVEEFNNKCQSKKQIQNNNNQINNANYNINKNLYNNQGNYNKNIENNQKYGYNPNTQYNNNANQYNNNYYPQNMNNYEYKAYNEIVSDNNLKEYFRTSNGGLVKSYAYYECHADKNKDNIRFKIIENFNGDQNKMLLCLFNGHGGNEVSTYLQYNFDKYMKRSLPFKDIPQDLTKLFKFLDEKIEELNAPNIGATATVIYIDNQNGKRKLYCANIGNNRCLLVNRKGIWKISNDHKINDPEEHKRIIKKGGVINIQKLFWKLSFSRAFGVWSIKQYGGVISEPHISITNINDDDMYLLVVSDKFWKFVKNEECFKIIGAPKSPLEICKRLSNELLNRGLDYNVGSIVINFKY